ncbi:MAG TPA: FtsX-like permease family protein [Planctomycetota bacterium]|nr:FtsX-like permease family protein [Planctomycetota bacterium]
MKPLQKKLVRDLWELRGQAFAIAFVMAGGVATLVMSLSTLEALERTRSDFYAELGFADVFVDLERAPQEVASRLREISGVEVVETRVTSGVKIEVEGFDEPIAGQLVSIPETTPARLHRLFLRSGRLVRPGDANEVVVSEPFAEAHALEPGDTIGAVIRGRWERLEIVGIALSAEFVYQIRPGDLIPDYERYGVFWMSRNALAAASDMEGAFNNVIISLSRTAHEPAVIAAVDRVLEPYGGRGAYGRDDQTSHSYLTEEFRQLEQMATIFPTIFLGVAAFLLSVILRRLIATQRDQIAILKAFGYIHAQIGWHYTQLVLAITAVGLAFGLALGSWLGWGMSRIYMSFYRFPEILYRLEPRTIFIAGGVSVLAALIGTWRAVLSAVHLPPAEAMRSEPPSGYKETFIEKLGLGRFLSQPTRMILRNMGRRPLKTFLSTLGIALACAILMVGSFQSDAIDHMVGTQFRLSQREDLTVTFVEATTSDAVFELESLLGVTWVEPFRAVPVRLRAGHRSERVLIQGIAPDGEIHRLLDDDLEPIHLPGDGLVLTDWLAEKLGVGPGDSIVVEVLEGKRAVRQVGITAVVRQYIGMAAYMDLEALWRVLREGQTISGAWMSVDSRRLDEIYDELAERPGVAGVSVREHTIRSFYETLAQTILVFTFFNTLLAGSISFGVVYNNARIALSERNRELASLRVLGFTRAEISHILLGEIALLTLIALPPGFAIGRLLVGYLAGRLQSDLYRVPFVLERETYAFAALVILASTVLSGLIVLWKLWRLDLMAALKSRE